mmetsp:Transcript_61272/g.145879  ORF Transcript_61272/g.145879 Transcript_61272/m.145879 type:complete len:284 (-) Transcript_61272:1580-2431(-)
MRQITPSHSSSLHVNLLHGVNHQHALSWLHLLHEAIRHRDHSICKASIQDELATHRVGQRSPEVFHEFILKVLNSIIASSQHCKADINVGALSRHAHSCNMRLLPESEVDLSLSVHRQFEALASSYSTGKPGLALDLLPAYMQAADLHRGEILFHILELHPENGHGVFHLHTSSIDSAQLQLQCIRPLAGVLAPISKPRLGGALTPWVADFHHSCELAIHHDFPHIEDAIRMWRLKSHCSNLILGFFDAFLCAAHAHKISLLICGHQLRPIQIIVAHLVVIII